ncbi:MAG: glycosyltransferase [Thermodesulfobacteriota bacterium]
MSRRIVKVIYQTFLPHQGRYPRLAGQARILAEAGFAVTVLACDRDGHHPKREERDGIEIIRIPVPTGEMRGPLAQLLPLLRFWRQALAWLRRHPYDLLHCHNLDILPLGVLARRALGRPVLYEAHEPNYYALWPERWAFALKLVTAIEHRLIRAVDGVSVTNDYQVDKCRQLGARRVLLAGNYPLPHLRVAAIPEEKWSRAAVTFGRLGTIYPDTGFEASFAALTQVLERHPATRFLVGGRVVDRYQEAFSRLVAPVREAVQLAGAYPAEQMPDLYRAIDVSLLIYPRSPWFRNITPRKYFDSLANGVPVIMTDIGGLGRVIRERQCGLVVDDQDPAAIAAAMATLITNPALRRRLADNALALAATDYDWARMARAYVALQEEILAAAGRGKGQ